MRPAYPVRLPFLIWFAHRDLMAAPARGVSGLIAATVLAATGLSVVMYGLALGHERSRIAALAADPLALCLWIGGGRGEVTEDAVRRIRDRLPGALADPGGLLGCHQFDELSLSWYREGVPGPGRTPTLLGRTLDPGDPLLASLPPHSGRAFGRGDEEGVYVSRAMLEILDIDPARVPATLHARGRVSGKPVAIPVVGASDRPFPLNYYFVMTDAYARALAEAEPDERQSTIRTGPVPEAWLPAWPLPGPALEELEKLKVRVVGREDKYAGKGKVTVWVLSSEEQPPPLASTWAVLLRGVRDTIREKVRDDPAPGFEVPWSPPEGPAPRAPEGAGAPRAVEIRGRPTDLAGVNFRDLEDLRPAADFIRGLGLSIFNADKVAEVESFERQFRNIVALLAALTLIAGLLCVWNITVIQDLRARQKVTEIGMLKAIGMDDAALRWLHGIQGVMLWAVGSAIGVAGGYSLGPVVGLLVRADAKGPPAAFHCPPWLILLVLLVSGVTCTSSSLIGTSRARKASPIESLTQN